MAALDFFDISPGDRKRAELELQNRIRLGQGLSDIDKKRALDIRDSNQLSADFERHKQEREIQDALSSMYPANDPSLSPDQNQTLSMIHAADKMNEIKAAQPLASSATNMNVAEQATAARPFNYDLGTSGATSAITGNEASTAANLLNKAVNRARQTTAPQAARQADVTNAAELVNKYERATSPVPASERERALAENINATKEANAANTSVDARTQNVISSALSGARQGEYNQGFYNGLNGTKAAEAANQKNEEEIATYKFLLTHPELSAKLRYPSLNSAFTLEQLGGFGGLGGGGLNPSVGPKPLGTKLQRP